MITSLVLFISTFFSIYHLISSIKYKDLKILYEVRQRGISILVPCYNEAPIIRHTIKGLMDVEYDELEVIFINDGSTDDTLQILKYELDLEKWEGTKGIYISKQYSNFYVIDKENSGKAESLNKGIKFSSKELIVTMDGDCVLDKKALLKMNAQFEDEDVIASGGVVHILQMFKLDKKLSSIVRMQILDYIKGFYYYKSSLAYNDALSIISGAFGIFRRDILCELGGFKKGLGEDIDITIRFQQFAKENKKKVVFSKSAICYTECPETLGELLKQRIRWQKGFIDSIMNNSKFLFSNIFKNNVCFFIIVDALISNSFATIFFVFNIILFFARIFYGYSTSYFLLIYFINTILFNVLCAIISIRKAKQNILEIKILPLYLVIVYDILIFQFLRILFFVTGTIAYYFNNENWQKVSRTSNDYNI